MNLPASTQLWIQTVSLHLDVAVATARSAVEPAMTTGASEALGAVCRRSSTLALDRLAKQIELSNEEQLAAWCLVAGQLSVAIASRLEALSGGVEVTLGALAAIAYHQRPSAAIDELGPQGKLFRLGLVESADDPRGARVRHRRRVHEQWGFAAKVGKGLGISALFSGPPGTGKTMVAALIAKDLDLELYQVDVGKLVSKWIGETEKQLGELFDAAEAGHAVLLFDEADALFGKRTEVKSSNDRYANLETNYLLQRLESFTGICLLTTNHESNMDPAFQRRLSLHLRFEVPDVTERAHLWHAMIPTDAPIEDGLASRLPTLATKFEMSGGHIRNSVLRAAFFAAEDKERIGFAHLERAARIEYEGIGKISYSYGAE